MSDYRFVCVCFFQCSSPLRFIVYRPDGSECASGCIFFFFFFLKPSVWGDGGGELVNWGALGKISTLQHPNHRKRQAHTAVGLLHVHKNIQYCIIIQRPRVNEWTRRYLSLELLKGIDSFRLPCFSDRRSTSSFARRRGSASTASPPNGSFLPSQSKRCYVPFFSPVFF